MPVSKKKYVLKGFLEPNSAKKSTSKSNSPKPDILIEMSMHCDWNSYCEDLDKWLAGNTVEDGAMLSETPLVKLVVEPDSKCKMLRISEEDIVISALEAALGHEVTFDKIVCCGNTYTDLSEMKFSGWVYEETAFLFSYNVYDITLKAKKNGKDVTIFILGVYLDHSSDDFEVRCARGGGVIEIAPADGIQLIGKYDALLDYTIPRFFGPDEREVEYTDELIIAVFLKKEENGFAFCVLNDEDKLFTKISFDGEKLIFYAVGDDQNKRQKHFWSSLKGEDVVFEKGDNGSFVCLNKEIPINDAPGLDHVLLTFDRDKIFTDDEYARDTLEDMLDSVFGDGSDDMSEPDYYEYDDTYDPRDLSYLVSGGGDYTLAEDVPVDDDTPEERVNILKKNVEEISADSGYKEIWEQFKETLIETHNSALKNTPLDQMIMVEAACAVNKFYFMNEDELSRRFPTAELRKRYDLLKFCAQKIAPDIIDESFSNSVVKNIGLFCDLSYKDCGKPVIDCFVAKDPEWFTEWKEARAQEERENQPDDLMESFLGSVGVETTYISALWNSLYYPETSLFPEDEKSKSTPSLMYRVDDNAGFPLKSVIEFFNTMGWKINNINPADLPAKKRELLKALKKNVRGQDLAVEKFTDGYIRYVMNGKKEGKPAACYLFAGPPGVGKTFLAKQFANLLKDEGYKYKCFDMAAYGGASDGVTGLVGFESSWGKAKPGQLTGFVRQHPKCVLLFDEIEKASPQVRLLFLSVLEGGSLTDKYYDEPVSFEQAIIIFTTNEGKDLYEDNKDTNLTLLPDTAVVEGLRASNFAPELLSRFASGNIIVFNHMGYKNLLAMLNGSEKSNGIIDSTVKKLSSQNGLKCEFEYDMAVSKLCLLSRGSESDARMIKSSTIKRIEDLFMGALEYLRRLPDKKPDFYKQLRKVSVKVDVNDAVREYFEMSETPRVLVFSKDRNVKKLGEKTDETLTRTVAKFDEKLGECNWNSSKREDKYDAIIIDSKKKTGDDWITCLKTAGKANLKNALKLPVIVLDDDIDDMEALASFGATNFIDRKSVVSNSLSDPFTEIFEGAYFAKKAQSLANSGKRISSVSEFKCANNTLTLTFNNLGIDKATEDDAQARRENKKYLLIKRPQVSLEKDVFGSEMLKDEIRRCADNIKHPEKYKKLGLPLMKGILMYGAAGMGKTLIAKAIAFEASSSESTPVGFISAAGSDFVNGQGVREMETVFKIARRNRPCIIFIDEFDAISKSREMGILSGAAEAVLEKFLKEMDGVESDNDQVYVIAATNYSIDYLDTAVTRRFSSKIRVPSPTLKEREKFLVRVLEGKRDLKPDDSREKFIDIDDKDIPLLNKLLTRVTHNYAEIEQFINESISAAVFEANQNQKEKITVDFNYLSKRIHNMSYGTVRPEDEGEVNKVTAYHEAGHAVLMYLFGRKIDYVTVIPRAGYGGYAMADCQFVTDKDFREEICICLGGRTAEKLLRKSAPNDNIGIHNTIGPQSDLQSATRFAYDYVCRYGLSGRLLVVPESFGTRTALPENVLPASENEAIWNEVKELLTKQEVFTEQMLRSNWEAVKALAESLIKAQELTGGQVRKIIRDKEAVTN